MMENQSSISTSDGAIDEMVHEALTRAYFLMALGLAVTAAVSLVLSRSENYTYEIFFNAAVYFPLMVVWIGIMIVMIVWMDKISAEWVQRLFFLFSAVTGVLVSYVFLRYDLGEISLAFAITTTLFASMAFIGAKTQMDLTGLGSFLMSVFFTMFICGVANFGLHSNGWEWTVSIIGIIIFAGFTAFEAQDLKDKTRRAIVNGEEDVVRKIGINGVIWSVPQLAEPLLDHHRNRKRRSRGGRRLNSNHAGHNV